MRENELEKVLKEQGQEHIWEAYQKLDEAGKEKLAAQVERVDWSMVAMAGHEELAQERGKLELFVLFVDGKEHHGIRSLSLHITACVASYEKYVYDIVT